MMRRYQYSISDVTRFEVAIYDEESNLKSLKEIGVTQKDGSALNILVKVIGCVLCVAGSVAGGALLMSA